MFAGFARKLLFASASIVAMMSVAEAAVYNLNRTIGAGSVVGTVTTDGTIGVLSTGNVTDWTLTLNDGTSSFVLVGAGPGDNSDLLIYGSAFSASATELLFDFSLSGGALFQNPNIGSGTNWYCIEGPFANCTNFGNANGPSETVTVGITQLGATRQGSVVIGTTGVTPVPGPAALAVFSVGLLGLGLARRKG